MHKISAFIYSIVLISLTGCEDKKPDETPIAIENTTEFVSYPQDEIPSEDRFKINKQQEEKESISPLPDPSSVNVPEIMTKTNTFILLDTKSKSRKITFSDEKLIFPRYSKSIVIINLFATWCPPCIGGLPSLNILQKKYKDDLSIIGILVHDNINNATLESFIAKHEINYFTSSSPHNNAFSGRLVDTLHLPSNFSIPLTAIYVDGKYFTHYEGSVPLEMIEYDIQQAQKQLKLKSNED